MWFILAMTEVIRVVDHVLVWLFGYEVIFSESCIHTQAVGPENVTAEEILFPGVLRHYVSHNIDAITVTLPLNGFDIVQIHFVVCI